MINTYIYIYNNLNVKYRRSYLRMHEYHKFNLRYWDGIKFWRWITYRRKLIIIIISIIITIIIIIVWINMGSSLEELLKLII